MSPADREIELFIQELGEQNQLEKTSDRCSFQLLCKTFSHSHGNSPRPHLGSSMKPAHPFCHGAPNHAALTDSRRDQQYSTGLNQDPNEGRIIPFRSHRNSTIRKFRQVTQDIQAQLLTQLLVSALNNPPSIFSLNFLVEMSSRSYLLRGSSAYNFFPSNLMKPRVSNVRTYCRVFPSSLS